MEIKLLFFGPLAEVTGKTEVILKEKAISDIKDLTEYLYHKYPGLAEFSYQVSINKNIVKDNQILKNKDEIGLLPPFAGG